MRKVKFEKPEDCDYKIFNLIDTINDTVFVNCTRSIILFEEKTSSILESTGLGADDNQYFVSREK